MNEIIGFGTFGQVYKSTALASGETAEKWFKTPQARDFEMNTMRVLQQDRMDEPNRRNHLVHCFQEGQVYYKPHKEEFIVHTLHFELFPLGNLSDFLRHHQPPITEGLLWSWTGDIAQALSVVHHLGLVHADMKKENILVHVDAVSTCQTSAAADLQSAATTSRSSATNASARLTMRLQRCTRGGI